MFLVGLGFFLELFWVLGLFGLLGGLGGFGVLGGLGGVLGAGVLGGFVGFRAYVLVLRVLGPSAL